MTAYETKRAEMMAKAETRAEAEKQAFLAKLDKVIIKNDWKPYVAKLTQTKKGYTEHTVIKHPTGVCTYTVTFYDNNRQYYKSTEYFWGEIPKTHKAQFEELENLLKSNIATKQDILEYEEVHGAKSAQDLLILAGPDNWGGSINEYNALLEELEKRKLEV